MSLLRPGVIKQHRTQTTLHKQTRVCNNARLLQNEIHILHILESCNFHTKMNNLTQGSLGQAASSEDFSASEFYYTVHVHT